MGSIVIESSSSHRNMLSISGDNWDVTSTWASSDPHPFSISSSITGNYAVYVVEVTAIDDEKLEGNFSQQKTNIVNQSSSAANGQSYNALKEDADVIDNRSDFY